VPQENRSFWPQALAGAGYLATFLSCLVGTTLVLIALGIAIVVDLARGLATGSFRQRLRKPRW
jgi:hypothetical protein